MKGVCLYHGTGCTDGIASAWVVWQKYGDRFDYFPIDYDLSNLPDCTGRDVLMVDFSLQGKDLYRVVGVAKSVRIFDHHTTAQRLVSHLIDKGGVTGVIDVNRSACMILWDHFFPLVDTPEIFKYIEDRDLERFSLKFTDEITEAIYYHHNTIESFNLVVRETDVESIILEGSAVIGVRDNIVGRVLESTEFVQFEGYRVPIVNCHNFLISAVGTELCHGNPFSICYYDHNGLRHFKLRSDGQVDVSKIAEKHGGGGRKRASGFRWKADVCSMWRKPKPTVQHTPFILIPWHDC